MPPSLRLSKSCYNALSRLASDPQGFSLDDKHYTHDITYIAMDGIYMPFKLLRVGQSPRKKHIKIRRI